MANYDHAYSSTFAFLILYRPKHAYTGWTWSDECMALFARYLFSFFFTVVYMPNAYNNIMYTSMTIHILSMNAHSCIPVNGWRDVGPTSSNTQSTLSCLHSDVTRAKSCSKRCESRLITTTILSIVPEISLGARTTWLSQCSHVGELLHISGQRNKRSRHGSVVLHSCHADANKQITESCRF